MTAIEHCPVCADPAPAQAATLDAEKRRRFLEFDVCKYGGLMRSWLEEFEPAVSKCSRCGHCWYRFQPSAAQLEQMYAAGRFLDPHVTGPPREPTRRMLSEMVRMRSFVGRQSATPTLLDYGSGHGRWARAAVLAGFRVTGFEPSMVRGMEPDAPFELVHDLGAVGERRFDVIQLEQVLEHLPDPLSALERLRPFCHERSIVWISVPNILRSTDGRDLWRTWPFDGRSPHVMAPFEHLHGFTPRSLETLAERAGFQLLSGLRVWRYYPASQLRRTLGAASQFLGTTSLMLRAAHQPLVRAPNVP